MEALRSASSSTAPGFGRGTGPALEGPGKIAGSAVTQRIAVFADADAWGNERWRLFIGKEESFLDTVFDPAQFPTWLSDQVQDYYVSQYSRNSFVGPLSHYRARDRNWQQSAFLEGCKIQQPSFFIGGAGDPATELFMPNYEKLENHMPTCAARHCSTLLVIARRKNARTL